MSNPPLIYYIQDQFDGSWSVRHIENFAALCYTRSQEDAQFIADALNEYEKED